MYSSCQAFRSAGEHRSTADQMAELGVDPSTVAYCTTPDGIDLNTFIILSEGGSLEWAKSEWRLDVQLSKGFRFRDLDVQAILTVYNLFSREWGTDLNTVAFLQETDADGNGLNYQDDDPTAPYYDQYYGADDSPVLAPIGEPLNYTEPRRYEIGVRIEFWRGSGSDLPRHAETSRTLACG